MGEFFHSWQRKTGAVTLAMACLCVGMWVRSQSKFDLVTLSISNFDVTIGSCHSGLIVLPQKSVLIRQTAFGHQSNPTFEVRLMFQNEPISNVPGLHWNTMQASKLEIYESEKLSPLQDKMMSYWSVTIPLTVISFWLLLTKPHKSTQKKISENSNAEGA